MEVPETPAAALEEPSSEPVAPPAASVESASDPMPPPPTAPKKRGRPQGAKDTFKRTRRPPVQVRIEPLETASPEPKPDTPRAEPKHTPEPEPKVEVPKSPRTQMREATQHLVSLRAAMNENKKAEHVKKYTEKWMTWPLH